MKAEIRVGVCGFPEARSKLFQDFQILEVQQTFYHPPLVLTAERWRAQAPNDFVFTLKAWQLITHEASSPTYRRLKMQLLGKEKTQAGSFRWNKLTQKAWQQTIQIAQALRASAVVLQTPRSFEPCTENFSRMRYFLSQIDRQALLLVFEPRGPAWTDEIVLPLIEELGLIHAVDPFLRTPLPQRLNYFRLHGKPAYHYHYSYSEEDFEFLAEKVAFDKPNWVLFNNSRMAEDARRFLKFLHGKIAA
ncbi:MAG: hypothetical protein AXA67_04500 [Methylothermaceae bacteria B42]|nr:MAG: hypothetical protein AXA67_04500 [Methylothermaceae bacteria B42]HHJ39948.1 DUF72 domain-containing protein [Methylothermaceae bacterium]